MRLVLPAPAAIGDRVVGTAVRLTDPSPLGPSAIPSAFSPATTTSPLGPAATPSSPGPATPSSALGPATTPSTCSLTSGPDFADRTSAIPVAAPAGAGDSRAAGEKGAEDGERKRFEAALEAAKAELAALAEEDSPAGAVFAAHYEMADDPLLAEQVEAALNEGLSAPEAIDAAAEAIGAMFADIDDEYLRARADDVRDVCRRIRGLLPAPGGKEGAAEPGPDGKESGSESVCDDAVIIADELFPSDLARMDLSRVRAFVTARGSVTSHICIIARSKGIPVLLGVDIAAIPSGVRLLVDAPSRRLVVDPSPTDLAAAPSSHDIAGETIPIDPLALAAPLSSRKSTENGDEPSPDAISSRKCGQNGDERVSRDFSGQKMAENGPESLQNTICGPNLPENGPEPLRRVPVYANAASVEDVRAAMKDGADGIGVFRTELMFMLSQTMPTEDEQFAAYREAAELCGDKPLIIRTLDIGGDKALPYLALPREDNPYLGFRALRLCLSRPEELFKPQLRAIIRASAYGNVHILLPMVTSVGEVRAVRRLLAECMQELDSRGMRVPETPPSPEICPGGMTAGPAADSSVPRPDDPSIPVGVMIETPAAVLIADQLVQEADFFSIGTNDLTQYILAADRGNPAVAPYYDSLHPAVLRAISMTVAAAHGDIAPASPAASSSGQAVGGDHAGRRISVGVCGEMAADPEAASPSRWRR